MTADAGLLRLPVDRDVFHAIPLYTETTVVVVPIDHGLAAAEQLSVADLAGETVLRPRTRRARLDRRVGITDNRAGGHHGRRRRTRGRAASGS